MKNLFFSFCLLPFAYCLAQNPGDKIFNSSSIHTINITLNEPKWWDSLTYYYNDGATQYMIASITFDSIQMDSVGIRLKGNSSYGHVGTKKPIKLDLDQFVSGQNIDGEKKINLNNGFLDPTMMREKIFLDFMNKEGLPAPRCTYARVSYNGNYCGLYKIVEQDQYVHDLNKLANSHYDLTYNQLHLIEQNLSYWLLNLVTFDLLCFLV